MDAKRHAEVVADLRGWAAMFLADDPPAASRFNDMADSLEKMRAALEAVQYAKHIPGFGAACPFCDTGDPTNNPGGAHATGCLIGEALGHAR